MGYDYRKNQTECSDKPHSTPESMSEAPRVDGYHSEWEAVLAHPGSGNADVTEAIEALNRSSKAETVSPTDCGEDLAFLDDGKTLSRLPGEDVGVLCPGERGQYDALVARDDARQRPKEDTRESPPQSMPKSTSPAPVGLSEDELDDEFHRKKGGVPFDELYDLEKPHQVLDDDAIRMLSPEDQEQYFNEEEEYLTDFARRKQQRKIEDLGEETYRKAYPEEAKRYFGE